MLERQQSSCLTLPCAGTVSLCHHDQLLEGFLYTHFYQMIHTFQVNRIFYTCGLGRAHDFLPLSKDGRACAEYLQVDSISYPRVLWRVRSDSGKGWPILCRANTLNLPSRFFTYAKLSEATSLVITPGSESAIFLEPPVTGDQERKITHDFPEHVNVFSLNSSLFYRAP